MRKFDFGSIELKTLKGEPIPMEEKGVSLKPEEREERIREMISSMVLEAKDRPVKRYDMAQRIFQGEVELDTSDWDMIKKSVEESQGYITLVKGQFLKAMDAVKDGDTSKEK